MTMSNDIWKRKPQYMNVGRYSNTDDIRATWAGPISTKLYGDHLQELCHLTHNNLLRIRSSMMRFDPCLEYGIEHWHPDSRPTSAPSYHVSGPDKEKVAWHDPGVMFASYGSLQSLASQSTSTLVADSDAASVASSTAPSNFCYLCSTMEEHKKHQNRLRSARRVVKPGKPRVSYIAPRPRVKVKAPEPTEIAEVLYRIEVFTGGVSDAGTNANVYITLHGKDDSSLRTALKRGRGSSKFCFVRGSKETFYHKGPKLGDLIYITVEHERPDLKKKTGQSNQLDTTTRSSRHHTKPDRWYLDYIIVTNMHTDQSWEFWCKDWLFGVERDIEAAPQKKQERDLEVTVVTGTKRMAGTDAKVYITMYGKKGMSPKIHLRDDKHHKRFEKGNMDKFHVRIKDLGELRRIRIEHDGSGFASGWHLDKVIIEDTNQANYHYSFHYGGWISKDAGEGLLWRELRAQTKQDKEVKKGREIRYMVSVKTGDVRYAGTDANVFIQFVGSKGTTKKLQMDDARDNFERNMTEHFELRGIDVGPLTRVVVSHDNSGPGAGWYLEHVTVKRYLSNEEKKERLKRMRKFHKESPGLRKKRLAERLNKEDEMREGKDPSDSSESSDSDSEGDNKSRKSIKSREKDFSSEVFDRDGKILKIPEYEEYFFLCQQWLAADEGDGQTSRELAVEKKQTIFSNRQ